MNIGERNELLVKIMLICMRDEIIPTENGRIRSVGFADLEYRSPPRWFRPADLTNMCDDELESLALLLRINKSPATHKSDVYINNRGYSIKSLQSAPPALVNHTARPGFEFACNYVNGNINDIDKLVADYWALREAGRIREDVRNSDPLSPFRFARAILDRVLLYFLFTGSGNGVSPHPADFILDFEDPLNQGTWRTLTPENVMERIWNRLIFSIRSTKGMPQNYPYNANRLRNENIAIWTRHYQGSYRGALHVRLSK